MNFTRINDLELDELKYYSKLSENELRHYNEPNGGYFIAESPKVITRALNMGAKPISLLIEDKTIEGESKELISRLLDIPIYTAEFSVLTKLTGFKLTRGALCLLERPKLPTLEEICQNASRIAILENVMNPTNIGAIFRSAAALNIDAVILTNGCSDPYYRRASRVSMGTVFQIPWTYMDTKSSWPKDGIKKIKEMGFSTCAMALSDNSISISDNSLKSIEKLAIILGTEGEGLSKETIEACDYTVKIPMSHNVDSLNVAAASAVAFWELTR